MAKIIKIKPAVIRDEHTIAYRNHIEDKMKSSDHDFGFSFVSDDEIKSVDKANEIRDMVMPLLKNLMTNPEKDTIKWPNRAVKLQELIDKINKVVDRV